MPINTVLQRTSLVAKYVADTTHVGLASTTPGATAGTELTGGSPAYARQPTNWGTPANSTVAGTPAAHNVPAGSTVAGANLYDALSAGNYRDGVGLTSQPFSSQGTYQVALTYTQA